MNQIMVHTRSGEECFSRSRKDQNYWDRMRELSPPARYEERLLNGSFTPSSSDISDSEFELTSDHFHPDMAPDELQNPTQLNEAFIQQLTKTSPQSCPDVSRDGNVESYMSDTDDSTSSETRILIESAQIPVISQEERFSFPLEDVQLSARRELPFRNSRRSLALPEKTHTLPEILENESESSLNSETTSSGQSQILFKSVQANTEKRILPFRKSRLSLALPEKTHTTEEMSRNELESSLSDESVSSSREISGFIEKKKQFLGLLKLKQLGVSRFNGHYQDKSESDSEIDKNHNSKKIVPKRLLPRRTIHTPLKYKSFHESSKPSSKPDSRRSISIKKSNSENQMLTRSKSARNKPSEKNCNDFQVETTPTKNNFTSKNLRVMLKRTNVTPKVLCKAQSKNNPKTNTPVASDSLNQKATSEELNTKTVENNAELEDLLQSSSSDSKTQRKRIRSPIKSKLLVKKKKKTTVEKPQTSKKSEDETDEPQYICPVCHGCFTSMESLKHHEDNIHSAKKNRKCKHCERTFTRNDNYVNHLRQNAADLKSSCVNALRCDICKKLFTYLHVLRRHQNMHENRADYECKKCGKKFPRQDYLKTHDRLEHSDNPFYSCKYCDKEYKYKHSMENHVRSEHRNEKPYKCRFCDRLFSRKDYAKKHQANHKIKISKYTCDECDETFADKLTLQIHVLEHLKIKDALETEDCHIEVVQFFLNEDF